MKNEIRRALLVLAPALLGACTHTSQGNGGARGGDPAYGSAPSGGPCWPVAPVELQALEHGREFEPIAAVTADGSLAHAEGGSLGAIRGDVLYGRNGQMTCRGRQISIGRGAGAFYNERDELVIPGEVTIFVANDGTVFMSMHNRRVFGPPGSGAAGVARVVGPIATARHTAELLVLLSLGGPPHR